MPVGKPGVLKLKICVAANNQLSIKSFLWGIHDRRFKNTGGNNPQPN